MPASEINDLLKSIDENLSTAVMIDNKVFIKKTVNTLKIQALSLYEDFVKLEKELLRGKL